MEGRLGASITMWVPESMMDEPLDEDVPFGRAPHRSGTLSVGHLCEVRRGVKRVPKKGMRQCMILPDVITPRLL